MSQRQNYRLGLTETFYYDGLDRLDTATTDTGHGALVWFGPTEYSGCGGKKK